jgi:hypothetical protein
MKAYSLSEFSLICGVVSLEEDIGEIALEPVGERFVPINGVDGTVTMVENKGADNHFVKIKCKGTSNVNALMSAIYNLTRKSPGGVAGQFPFACKDRLGLSTIVAGTALITGWPPRTMGAADPGDVEWKIFVEAPERFEGGN